jgi:hypothetical protein
MTRASHSVEPAFIIPVGAVAQTGRVIVELVRREINDPDGPFPADMTITSVVSDRGGNYKNAASELGGGDNAHTW